MPVDWVVVGLDNGGTTNNGTVLDSEGRFLLDEMAERILTRCSIFCFRSSAARQSSLISSPSTSTRSSPGFRRTSCPIT